MKKTAILIVVLAALLIPIVVLASVVTGADYRTRITVTNNGTATANVAVTYSLSTSEMIAGGMLSDNASDAAMTTSGGADVAFQPAANSSYSWVTFVPSIGEEGSLTQYLYSLNATGGKLRYFPSDEGMGTVDHATLELCDNFTIEQKGWVDTTAVSGLLVYKMDAFVTYIKGTGNITSSTINSTQTTANTSILNAAGNYTGGFALVGAETEWEAMQTDDGDTSRAARTDTSYAWGMYNITPTSPPESHSGIYSVEVTFEIRVSGGGSGLGTPRLRLNGVEADGAEQSTSSSSYVTKTVIVPRPAGGSWQVSDLEDLQVGIGLRAPAGTVVVTYLAVIVNYITGFNEDVTVTATGISSGEHTVTTTANVTHLLLAVDNVTRDVAVLTANVTDNSENWTFACGNVMTYMESHRIGINETLQQDIRWEYGTVFTDLSAGNHNATPTFRTASSDPDVSAVVTKQEGTGAAVVPTTNVTGGWTMIAEVPETPLGLFDEGSDNYGVGELDVGARITAAAETAGQDPTAWHYVFALGLTVLGIGGTFKATHSMRVGRRGSLTLAMVVGLLILVFFYLQGTIAGWILIPYGALGLFLVAWSKSPSPVD